MKLEFSGQRFEKYSNIEFHENPFSGCRVFLADGRTDRQRDMTIILAFRYFANAPKMTDLFAISYSLYR
jgi:hypothetical protein